MTTKHTLPTAALVTILVLSAGVVFPLLFAMSDKILRSLLQGLDPTALMIASFAWLLLLYFYGIKFSLEYITRQFVVDDPQALFTYSTIAYAAVTLLLFASLISPSPLSNLLWGAFYLCTLFFFYLQGKKHLLKAG